YNPDNNYLLLGGSNQWATSSAITVLESAKYLHFDYMAVAQRNAMQQSQIYVEVLNASAPNAAPLFVTTVQGSWIQGWLRASINLGAFQDQAVKLRFRVDDDWRRDGRARID